MKKKEEEMRTNDGQLVIEVDDLPKVGRPHSMVSETTQLQTVPTSPVELLALAIERNLDIEKLRELMALEREWRADKAKSEYDSAMTEFGRLKQIIAHNRNGKTAGNAAFSYADFPQMVGAVTPWLTQCGLSFNHSQDPLQIEAGKIVCIVVHCDISHQAGHRQRFSYPAVPDPKLAGHLSPSQLIQLAITYAKRQTLAMALGLATAEDRDDDDSHGSWAKAISDKQAADLRALMEEIGADKAQVLKYAQAESIETISVASYPKVMKALHEKRQKGQK